MGSRSFILVGIVFCQASSRPWGSVADAGRQTREQGTFHLQKVIDHLGTGTFYIFGPFSPPQMMTSCLTAGSILKNIFY